MSIELFDKVVLKTGEKAFIVEIYEPGVAYEADIQDDAGNCRTETIKHEDILVAHIT